MAMQRSWRAENDFLSGIPLALMDQSLKALVGLVVNGVPHGWFGTGCDNFLCVYLTFLRGFFLVVVGWSAGSSSSTLELNDLSLENMAT